MKPRRPDLPAPLLVCGQVNVETVFRLPASGLPPEGGFFPGALRLGVSGVGANLARALTRLGSPVRLLTFAGEDEAGRLVRAAFADVDARFLPASATPQSLALVSADGAHAFYRDLKGLEDAPAPLEAARALLPGCAAALMTNVGWTRELLPLARAARVPILTDVQDLRGLDNPYDAPYFAAADVLLLSAAHLPDPAALLRALPGRSPARVLIAGLGVGGALLLERGGEVSHQPAFPAGASFAGGAGDTLAAAFAHFHFTRALPPPEALRLACAAAALKLRGEGSGQGHPSEEETRAFARSSG